MNASPPVVDDPDQYEWAGERLRNVAGLFYFASALPAVVDIATGSHYITIEQMAVILAAALFIEGVSALVGWVGARSRRVQYEEGRL